MKLAEPAKPAKPATPVSSSSGLSPLMMWLLFATGVSLPIAAGAGLLAWVGHYDVTTVCLCTFGITFPLALALQAIVAWGGR